MKLVVVSPRYGLEIAGGAETAARLLATHLAQRDGWTVEALTTCARDAVTWADAYPAGETVIDGVRVRRFPVVGPRAADFDRCSERILARPRLASADAEERWLAKQGPVAPELIDAIAACDADVFAFHPYLYHPTVAGLPRVARRAALHAAAHDEPALRLPMYRALFDATAGLAYWSEPERRLVEQRFAIASKPSVVVGLGVEPGAGDEHDARSAVGIGDRPYLLCLGRVDDGKGAALLAECFIAYKQRRPGPLQLVFAGPVVHYPPAHADVVVTGAVPENAKWGLLRGAVALVSPSAFESFSIVLMEAWSVGTPCLVNRRCAVTFDHVERSGGGLVFGSYAELEVALDRIREDGALRAALGISGNLYVDARYRWNDVIDRYASFLSVIATRDRRARTGR
jgi:glycosyltransferase involved in cell wall biosynthesis